MQTTQQLGRYEIIAELGRGAMGAVFRARDPKIDRTVAIKTIAVLQPDSSSAEQYRQRFFREAQAAGRLSHPGIVTIYDVDEDPVTQTPFIVMEYADGLTLQDFVLRSPGSKLPLTIALHLIEQIALALDYAHHAGIVHRDIKPTNVIVTAEGRAKIMDFGIAKLALAEATVPGYVMGTPAYMSPEQINGKPLDGRSDLFSLGVIAYWLLTGEKPFEADTVTEICVQIATKEPHQASQIASSLSLDYDYLLKRALAKDPAQRYQDGGEFAADVHDLLSGHKPRSQSAGSRTSAAPADKTVLITTNPENAASTSSSSKPYKSSKRKWIIAAGLSILLACMAAGYMLVSRRPTPATLQIVGQYPFHSGHIYIWVDGELRYDDELHSTRSRSSGESLAVTLPVRSGRHIVRLQVDAPGQIYDHASDIPGRFRPYSQKTLLVHFGTRNLDLGWE
ncbi:MAG TPA: serine/threonine-protein kinase [Candidatus Angelobacter sp.]|nr:serine/threonine-protein kinase [Candidatus Angelobacter sp.]